MTALQKCLLSAALAFAVILSLAVRSVAPLLASITPWSAEVDLVLWVGVLVGWLLVVSWTPDAPRVPVVEVARHHRLRAPSSFGGELMAPVRLRVAGKNDWTRL
jgi:hypothetical protein